jgi:hypothetical protein
MAKLAEQAERFIKLKYLNISILIYWIDSMKWLIT